MIGSILSHRPPFRRIPGYSYAVHQDTVPREMPGLRIALFLYDRLNDYQALNQADGEQAARRCAVHLSVFSAENSAETQIRQVRAALSEPEATRPRALLICPVSEMALMPLAHNAARLGIAWVLLSRWSDAIHDFRRQYPQVPIFAVLPDQLEIGRIQGQQLRALLHAGDELVYIQGPIATYSTRYRRVGLEKEIASVRDIRLSLVNGDWSEQSGESAMKVWLSAFTTRRLRSSSSLRRTTAWPPARSRRSWTGVQQGADPTRGSARGRLRWITELWSAARGQRPPSSHHRRSAGLGSRHRRGRLRLSRRPPARCRDHGDRAVASGHRRPQGQAAHVA